MKALLWEQDDIEVLDTSKVIPWDSTKRYSAAAIQFDRGEFMLERNCTTLKPSTSHLYVAHTEAYS